MEKLKPYLFLARPEERYPWAYSETVLLSKPMAKHGRWKMLSSKQKKLINIAWQETEKVVKDWLKSPYAWASERDVQAEIVGRLRRRYERIRQGTIWPRYIDKRYGKRFLKEGVTMGRVVCEPPVYYRPRKGRYEAYRPDVVVFDDIKHPEHPKQDQYQTKSNDDMLWVCELKYKPP